jgi:ferredoxin-NADP reductase
MAEHIVKVLDTEFLTHNVKRFVVEKPADYTYIAGQATDVSINTPELKDELRPFTFTSLKGSDVLEFTIKIYKGHNGMTEKLLDVNAGDELILHDIFGTINYKGPGLFIAGGAGITPFIAIFRELSLKNELSGNKLLFANRTAADVILRDELKKLLGDNYIDVIEEPENAGGQKQLIDIELLKKHIDDNTQFFYICGPEKFTEIMIGYLHDLGINDERIIIEQ